MKAPADAGLAWAWRRDACLFPWEPVCVQQEGAQRESCAWPSAQRAPRGHAGTCGALEEWGAGQRWLGLPSAEMPVISPQGDVGPAGPPGVPGSVVSGTFPEGGNAGRPG